MSRALRHLGQREPHVPTLPERRPAETATLVTGALVFLAGRAFDLDADVQGALVVVVGALPAGVTWCVERWRARLL